jgi:alpha-L-fucosidase
MVRELQPGIIINNRASIPGDFDTPEQKIGMYQAPRPWESCITLCESWSFSPTPVKSVREIIDLLTSTACGNGNLLLSWGPKWSGAFDALQTERLVEVGKWLGQYGYTIYGTKGGPWYPEKWGGSTMKGNKAYIHVTSGKTGKIILPKIPNKLTGFKSLTGQKIRVIEDGEGITIEIGSGTDLPDSIIELTFENNIGRN